MIRLARVAPAELYRLAGLRQLPGQYANDGADMIRDPTPGLSFHAIEAGAVLVGMFKLDPRYHERHAFAAPDSIGLRGVLIDAGVQGRGYGRQAMTALPAHVRAEYPDARQIVLTVNLLNPAARATYLKSGFRDAGEIYTGGTRGPQHVMRLDL